MRMYAGLAVEFKRTSVCMVTKFSKAMIAIAT